MQKFIQIRQDLSGKIRNLKLSAADYLFPLYEVVINSVQSIHESKEGNGEILIVIERDSKGLDFKSADYSGVLKSFTVSDNGVGFNNANFDSFCTADTPHKLDLGCKGVGRFVALKAFEKVIIESTYLDEKTKALLTRELGMSREKGLFSSEPVPSESQTRLTKTKLENYLPDFRKPTNLATISRRLLDHCLIYFINGNAPKITIFDEESKNSVDLNQLYKKFIQQDDVIDYFEINTCEFEIFYIKKYTEKGRHQLHYCANNREVSRKPLSKIIPNLKDKLTDERGQYFLSIYIKSAFLDDKVYAERNLFNIPDIKSKKKLFDFISFEEIEDEIAEKIKTNYKQELAAIANGKKIDIVSYVYRDGLEYRHLLAHEELIESIPPGLSDDRLDVELHKVNHKLEKLQKARVNKFLANRNTVENHVEYQEELRELVNQEQDLTQAKLATYLTRRKVIIKVLDRFLGVQDNGKFVYEKEIHNIIFPRFTDSKTVNYKEHNLWVLDERLTYHQYISSDNPINTYTNGSSEKEPDLILFDKRFAFGESDLSSIVIFEFKRPMRRLTGEDKKVHNQVIGYVEDLMQAKAVDARGRYNDITAQTPKFGFIVCDYDKEMEDYLIEFGDFNKTPKGTLFLYKKGINLMLEVMNYKTLMADVDMRHKAFFKEMGIDRI